LTGVIVRLPLFPGRNLAGWQIVVCLAGIVTCLFPTLTWTRSFWGLEGFFPNLGVPEYWIAKVQPGSPAAAAGLQKDDRIVGVNDQPTRFGFFWPLFDSVQPGREIRLRVLREQEELTLRTTADKPRLLGVRLWYWQLLALPIFLILALLIAVTGIRRRRLFRPVLVALVACLLAAAIWEMAWPSYEVWSSQASDDPQRNGVLDGAGSLVAAVLALLAAFEIGETVTASRARPSSIA
jgi:hypothetical protein